MNDQKYRINERCDEYGRNPWFEVWWEKTRLETFYTLEDAQDFRGECGQRHDAEGRS